MVRTVALAFCVCLIACNQNRLIPPETVTSTVTGEHSRHETASTRIEARVEAIDYDERKLTLRGADDIPVDVSAPPEIGDIHKIKRGDIVVASFVQTITFERRPVSELERLSGAKLDVSTQRPKNQNEPGGTVAAQLRTIATVENIDREAGTLTLRGPDGSSYTAKAQDPGRLINLSTGDTIAIHYSETVAISVEPR